ncbi:Alpha/Beta hydrolase protein [Hyaloraphidium curvatum]|nr:Alpha/Beta hydrolase protein [Hyaloraphidium curvatum]
MAAKDANPHAVGDTREYLRHPMTLSPSDPALVKTSAGLIRGSVGARHLVWRNVPYACPPVGDLRWRPPKTPVPSWDDVRDGRTQGNICPQLAGDSFDALLYGRAATQLQQPLTLDEDCLNVNIYAPNYRRLSVPNGLPVMVFPAAVESFAHGSNGHFLLDATALVETFDVVVVVVNCRLNLFGFLGSRVLEGGGPPGTGNYGLLDLAAACRWIRSNVADFGGDPTRITAFGSNVGAVALHYLMLFAQENLFDRVILQNGTAGSCPPQSLAEAEMVFDALCAAVNVDADDRAAKAEQLRSLAFEDLLRGLEKLKLERPDLYAIAWRPTFDGSLVNRDHRAMEGAGDLDPSVREIILGICDGAGSFLATHSASSQFQTIRAALGPGMASASTVSELLFEEPIGFSAEQLAKKKDLKLAMFRWKRVLRRTQLLGHASEHQAMELPFIFLSTLLTPPETIFANEVIGLWTRFAATGETWTQYSERRSVLEMTATGIQIVEEPTVLSSHRDILRKLATEQSARVAKERL